MSLTTATVIFLSVALGLQLIAGLLATFYRDLNPARQVPKELDRILNAPRGMRLHLDLSTESTADTKGDSMRRAHRKASYESRGDLLEYVDPDLLPVLNPEPEDTKSPLAAWWSRLVSIHGQQLREGPVPTRILSSPWRPWNFQDWEIDAIRNGLRNGSFVLLGVIAIIRIAHGEPLLRLF